MNQHQSIRIAFIQAGWHSKIVSRSYDGFIATLAARGIVEEQVNLFHVPGSLEIPLLAQRLAKQGEHDVIVCAGFVVDGGIYRHDFVAQAVLDGMMRVQLDHDIPILSIVLTPHQFQDTAEHRQFFMDHFVRKGEEAAEACLSVLRNMNRFNYSEPEKMSA